MSTGFVRREGSELRLGDRPFRFSGANLYWLGLDENVGGIAYPTPFRIRNGLDTARDLGVSVVRSHMMTSTGQGGANPLAIMPRLGEYSEAAFAPIDQAIAHAGRAGLRLILPLTDEWSYYHGGHRDFTTPLGLTSADFYTHPEAVAAFQDYVAHVLGRTNAVTGVRYVDDPTILAWELGNELEGMTPSWIADQVAFVKARAPHQLVAAGRRFGVDDACLEVAGLDIVDAHYYPPDPATLAADAARVTAAGKVYIVGEYGSVSASDSLLGPVAADPRVAGMILWSLFGHHDDGGFVGHDDGFTLHVPGTTESMRANVAAVRRFGEALGAATGTVEPTPPVVTHVSTAAGVALIGWRGSAGATEYRVERLEDDGWRGVAVAPAEASPLRCPVPSEPASYRVVALAPGRIEAPSEAVRVASGSRTIVAPDALSD